MVRRFVQDQHIRRMDQGGGQGHPLTLSPGKRSDFQPRIRQAKPHQHSLRLIFLQFPEFRGKPEKHLLKYCRAAVHLRVLPEKTDLNIWIKADFALIRILRSGTDPQKGAFPRPVDPDHADLVSRFQIQAHIFQ